MRSMLVAWCVLAYGCGDGGSRTGELFIELVNIADFSVGQDCACFWPDYEYVSEAACRADLGGKFTPNQEDCVLRAGSNYPEFADRFACVVRAESARFSCYSGAPTCDPDAFDACDDVYDATVLGCQAEDPCAGLGGSDATACEQRRASMVAAFSACD